MRSANKRVFSFFVCLPASWDSSISALLSTAACDTNDSGVSSFMPEAWRVVSRGIVWATAPSANTCAAEKLTEIEPTRLLGDIAHLMHEKLSRCLTQVVACQICSRTFG